MSYRRTIHLDSDQATSSTGDGAWTWLFPGSIRLGPQDSVIEVCMTLFSFYSTVYNVKDGVNGLLITVGGIDQDFAVDEGQYSIDSIAEALGAQSTDLFFGYNVARNKFVIQCAESFVLQGGSSSSIAATLGFVPGVSYTSAYDVTQQLPYVLTSPNLCDLGGTRFVEVRSSLKTMNVLNSKEGALILARVPITSQFGDHITWYSDGSIASVIRDHVLDGITIYLYDSAGNPVDFGGTTWSMSLQFTAEPTEYQSLDDVYRIQQNSLPSETTQT